jgi:hypothetical protein
MAKLMSKHSGEHANHLFQEVTSIQTSEQHKIANKVALSVQQPHQGCHMKSSYSYLSTRLKDADKWRDQDGCPSYV